MKFFMCVFTTILGAFILGESIEFVNKLGFILGQAAISIGFVYGGYLLGRREDKQ